MTGRAVATGLMSVGCDVLGLQTHQGPTLLTSLGLQLDQAKSYSLTCRLIRPDRQLLLGLTLCFPACFDYNCIMSTSDLTSEALRTDLETMNKCVEIGTRKPKPVLYRFGSKCTLSSVVTLTDWEFNYSHSVVEKEVLKILNKSSGVVNAW